MVIHGKQLRLHNLFVWCYTMALPNTSQNQTTYVNLGGVIRYALCKHIFKKCGKHVNVERKAHFASGVDIEIGDYSGIGINAHIPNGTLLETM